MTKYEEIFLISSLLSKANTENHVDLNDSEDWSGLYLKDETRIHEDYLFELNEKGFLNYEEIGEDGFKPIIICSIKSETREYLKKLIHEVEKESIDKKNEIENLNTRITEILTFDPKKLSAEINSTEDIILKTKEQLLSNPILQPLSIQLDKIETHFKSLSKVAHNYEEVYKNIILPVKEEGRSGIRQTVKWAIISIVASTILSVIINSLTK